MFILSLTLIATGLFDNDTRLLLPELSAERREKNCDKETDDKEHNKITGLQCIAHLLRGNVIPTCVLTLPMAFKYAGLWTGFFGIILVICLCVHCMHLLAKSSVILCQWYRVDELEYSETMELAVMLYSKKKYIGKIARIIVDVFLCLTYLGACSIFIIFIASNIKEFFEHFVSFDLQLKGYQTFTMLLLTPLSWIQGLKKLSIISMLGNIFTISALAIVLQYCVRDLPPATEFPAFTDFQSLVSFFGIVIFSISSIGLVLPLMNHMKNSTELTVWNGTMNTAMTFVTAIYLAIGFFGYMKFGLNTNPPLQLLMAENMPSDNWLFISIRLLYAVAVYCTYAIMFYIPVGIIVKTIERSIDKTLSYVQHCLLRTCLVFSTYILSISLMKVELIIFLFSSLTSASLTLVFPPLIDTLLHWPEEFGTFKWKLVKNALMMTFGLFGVFTGIAKVGSLLEESHSCSKTSI